MRPSPGQNRSVVAPRADRWLRRALIAMVAVIGVLAMHGLTMNHDAAMANMSTVTPLTAPGTGQLDAMTSAGNGSADMSKATEMPTGASALDRTTLSRIGMESPAAPMTTACLAFLAGLVLLVGAGRLTGRVRPEATTRPSRHSVSWFATALDRLRPDLRELSVLRT